MAITGSIIFAMLDLAVAFFVSLFSPQIDQFSLEMYLVAFFSGSIAIGIALFIRRKNYGFSYVPHDEDAAVNYKEKENLMLLFVAILSVISFAGTYFFTAQFGNSTSFLIVSLLLFLSSSILISISRKKERKEVS
ncbi:hypothetical protein [Xylanibacillus composti]|nr:hypothetical protein [Xylanibacillus composti]